MFYNTFILDSANTTEITWNVEPVPVEQHCMFIDRSGTWRSQACNETEQAFICQSGTLCMPLKIFNFASRPQEKWNKQILGHGNPKKCFLVMILRVLYDNRWGSRRGIYSHIW